MVSMARTARIHYPGAICHVMCRGNDGQDILFDESDRIRLYEPIGLKIACPSKSVDLMGVSSDSPIVPILVQLGRNTAT